MHRDPIQGELQEKVMRILWNLGSGTVDDVRNGLPEKQRGAYTTVQTVLNRLADRGLLVRERRGKAFAYRPLIGEADYLSNSLTRTLSAASTQEARLAALASLVGGLNEAEMGEINTLAGKISAKRSQS